jgi:SPX domain protein involved in polyphosphate accumulation
LEVEKVSSFLSSNIEEASRKLLSIKKNIEAYNSKADPGSPVSADLEFNLAKTYTSMGGFEKNIEQAVLELYRHLDLLKNYSSLNTLALAKILKKWDKVLALI